MIKEGVHGELGILFGVNLMVAVVAIDQFLRATAAPRRVTGIDHPNGIGVHEPPGTEVRTVGDDDVDVGI